MQSLNPGNVVGLSHSSLCLAFVVVAAAAVVVAVVLISLFSLGPKKASNQFSRPGNWVLNPLL